MCRTYSQRIFLIAHTHKTGSDSNGASCGYAGSWGEAYPIVQAKKKAVIKIYYYTYKPKWTSADVWYASAWCCRRSLSRTKDAPSTSFTGSPFRLGLRGTCSMPPIGCWGNSVRLNFCMAVALSDASGQYE